MDHQLQPRRLPFLIAAMIGCCSLWSPLWGADRPPDFVKEIRPLLLSRCWQCHGPLEQKGSLRLDSAAAARKGGHLSRDLLNKDVSKNELLKRLRSTDKTLRMPQEGPPLTTEQIALLERWIAAGAPWPAEAVGIRPAPPLTWEERYEQIVNFPLEHLFPAFGILLVFLVFILLLERGRQRGTTSDAPWIYRRLGQTANAVGYGGYWALVLMAVAVGLGSQIRFQAEEIAILRVGNRANPYSYAMHPEASAQDAKQPPQPIRPKHPPQLGGAYYRGNDERNEKLFNGGFYRTAVMEVFLIGPDDKILAWGDDLPPARECRIKLTIRRAPFATPALFTPEIMERIFLSQSCELHERADVMEEHVPIKVIESGEYWEAMYPLPALVDGERQLGIVYLQQGTVENGRIRANPHFAIGFNLLAEEGKIAKASELWLGTVLLPSNVTMPTENQISIYEWLDFRPIPEITGGNTADPKLLGVEQYLGPQSKTDDEKPADSATSSPATTNSPPE